MPISPWFVLVVLALLAGFLAGTLVGRQWGAEHCNGTTSRIAEDPSLESRLLAKLRDEMRDMMAGSTLPQKPLET